MKRGSEMALSPALPLGSWEKLRLEKETGQFMYVANIRQKLSLLTLTLYQQLPFLGREKNLILPKNLLDTVFASGSFSYSISFQPASCPNKKATDIQGQIQVKG